MIGYSCGAPQAKPVAPYFTPQWGDISRLTSGQAGQRPCLHAEVRCGTQAWPSAAGVRRFFDEALSQKRS
jgi:hypothetical protein